MSGTATTEGINQAKKRADEALNKADAQALHRLFMDKCDEVGHLVDGLGVVMSVDQGNPRPNGDAVMAIRDIALAAISLASDIAERSSK